MKRFCVCLLTFSLLCLASPAVSADNTGLDMRIDNCDDLFGDIMQMPDKGIPTDLLAKCSGVAIFPSVIKGGFIFAGRFGKGVIMHRNKKTGAWSAPAFYTIAGGSWGLQIGGQVTDLVLVINNERGMKGLLQSKFTIGGDASCAAGPVGRNVEVSTDLFLKAGILSYSRSKGLFAGIALDGAIIAPEEKSNELYYGDDVTAAQILMKDTVKPSSQGQELISTISKYSK